MAIAFAGLSIMSAPAPLALWSLSALFSMVEVRSMFFVMMIAVVILVLAYLTNPSETSFRQFLTEQSFRLHLSRLDDAQDEQCGDPDNTGYVSSRRGTSSISRRDSIENISPPCHFATRASVSLRTPKHFFRSFGVLTVAAVIPTGRRKLCRSTDDPSGEDDHIRSHKMMDSWFIGMFGRWWWAAPIDTWWKESYILARDEEVSRSGVLEVKALDRKEGYNDLQLTNKHSLESEADDRSRDRSTHNHNSRRSSTPPPLPKSASLPLHTKRLPPASPDDKQHNTRLTTSPQLVVPPVSDQVLPVPVTANVPTATLARPPSTLFDHTPVIAEILRQINVSQSSVQDLRGQLTEFQAGAVATHDALRSEVNVQRERKRMDEASRAELKSRTKQLEEARRGAESSKREAEKRLKAAQMAQANAETRIGRLTQEVEAMQLRITDDEAKMMNSSIETSALEAELLDEVEKKKMEIKIAEEVINALGCRAKELEESIVAETARLQKAKDDAEMRRQDRSFSPLHVISTPDTNSWPPLPQVYYTPPDPMKSAQPVALEPSELVNLAILRNSHGVSMSSLQALVDSAMNPPESRARGYPVFSEGIASLDQSSIPRTHTSFAPFADSPRSPRTGFLSPTGPSLIPNGLMHSLDIENNSQLNGNGSNGAYFDQSFDRAMPPPASPLSPAGSTYDDTDAPDSRPRLLPRFSFTRMDTQRATFPSRTSVADFHGPAVPLDTAPASAVPSQKSTLTRRWFLKEKKGLNPDAKEFSLSKDKERSLSLLLSRSRLNRGTSADVKDPFSTSVSSLQASDGSSPSLTNLSSFFTSRAFAPSAEEREALCRGLGAGSSNTSLERLPSLSDVGSLPASPNHVHSLAHQQNHHSKSLSNNPSSGGTTTWMTKFLPLPRLQTTFSPFADDESIVSTRATAGGEDGRDSGDFKSDSK